MIERIDITGLRFTLDDDIKKYVRKKFGRLDRYLPRHARKTVHAEVKLREANKKHGNKYECEVVLHLPSETMVARDSTLNIFAAVDIVEVKLRNQLKKYKDMHSSRRSRVVGILGRFKRQTTAPPVEVEQY